jgi:hypothetical protein
VVLQQTQELLEIQGQQEQLEELDQLVLRDLLEQQAQVVLRQIQEQLEVQVQLV